MAPGHADDGGALIQELATCLAADVSTESPAAAPPPAHPPAPARPKDALSDLCGICHRTPKYTCPRCRARTCSLACARAHKARAQCSGARDPAAYVRRAALATPAAFDRDYNFLAGLEVARERHRRDLTDRGIDAPVPVTGDARARRPEDQAPKGAARLAAAQSRSGVEVRRAPPGLARRRENGTTWSRKAKMLRWTVEWVLGGAGRTLGSLLEREAVGAGFAAHLAHLRTAGASAAAGGGPEAALVAALRTRPASLCAGLAALGPASTFVDGPAAGSEGAASATGPPAPDGPGPAPSPPDDLAAACHFYLHVPTRSAGARVAVVPLDPRTALGEALRGETVDEFPTVYVLGLPPEALRAAEGGRLRLASGRELALLDGERRSAIKRRLAELERANPAPAG